ncbi:MAG: SipW-dependent-type signal peptide-containing protein [Bacilli bacterium]|nr:SipW-dependent-type signal peptide-containing protein [Bacilli bacterium]
MKKLKNRKTLLFALLLLVLVGVGGTLAYYYSEATIANKFKTMTYDVVLREEFNNTWGTKKVYISNEEETSTPVVLRVNYNEVWKVETEDGISFLPNSNGTDDFATKTWTQTFRDDFIKGYDGWYYYKKVLNGQEEVQILDSVTKNTILISSSTDYDSYNDYDYELTFNYEAIQADAVAVSEIWGVETTISNGNVDWPWISSS